MNVIADTNWIAGAKVQLRQIGRNYQVVFIDELNSEHICFQGISELSSKMWYGIFEEKLHGDWRPV